MRLNVLLSILAIYLSAFSAYSVTLLNNQGAECNNKDQTQDLDDYGFFFTKSVIRWQEFTPTYNTLNQIELDLQISGKAGDVIVEIYDQNENILSTSIIKEENLVSGWTTFNFDKAISVNTNNKYKINVYSSEESESPSNRYFWDGSNSSTYDRGRNSVIDSRINFDFAFKTYGCNQTIASNNNILNETESSISLYPNPTEKSLFIKLLSNEITEGEVINAKGQTVKNIKLNNSITQVDIKDLENGLYFIRIITTKKVLLKKFVKNN